MCKVVGIVIVLNSKESIETAYKETTVTPMVNVRPWQASRAVIGAITSKFEALVFLSLSDVVARLSLGTCSSTKMFGSLGSMCKIL